MRVGPNMIVTGHPDATARMPLSAEETAARAAAVQLFLFDDEPPAPTHGDEMLVEIKTRGPDAFKRWRTLGAERSHPESVAQAAFYTLGLYGEMRDAAIATMDTGSRTWDHEVIPADQAWAGVAGRLRVARRSCRPLRAQRAGPGCLARKRLLCGRLAVPILPVPGHLPAGCG